MDNLSLSALPPLHSLTPSNNTLCSKSLIELREEIKKLYPRVHCVEKEIESIKNQIPSNLSKFFLNISTNVQKYQKQLSSQPQKSIINTNENGISAKLKEIENRLILEIDISTKKSSVDFDQKVTSLTKKSGSMKNHLFDEFDSEASSNSKNKIQNFEDRFAQQEKRLNQRLFAIKKTYESYKSEDTNQKLLQKYTNIINAQNEQIKEIRVKLSEINMMVHDEKENMNGNQAANDNDLFSQMSYQNTKMQLFNKKYDNVQNEIQNLVVDFNSSLTTLNEYSKELEKRIKRMGDLYIFLDEKTKEFERKSQENDSKCQIMIKKLSDITSNIGNDENNKELNNLSSKILKIHEDIQIEIESIKKGIKNCETAISHI